ncbi:30S ribosomal protein S2 [Patescibacteria group bacterium]
METKIPTIKEMLEAGVHFGHQSSRWNPKMHSFIFDKRNHVHILDLEKTQSELKNALDFLIKETKQGKKILFVGTKPQAKEIVKKAAQDCGMPYVVERWLGGTFTNFKTISRQVRYLQKLEEQEAKGDFEKYTKKEASILKDKIKRLNLLSGGLKEMEKLPAAIFVVDVVKEKNAVREANKLNVPVVALLDTNANPDLIDYPIPSNDDALKSLELLMGVISDAIKSAGGQVKVDKKEAKKGVKETSEKDKKQTKEEKGKVKAEQNVEEVMEDLETGI